jgi:hypothetical protein
MDAFDVLKTFVATNAISGRERTFKKGEMISAGPDKSGSNVVIEADSSLFIVERSLFDACCRVNRIDGDPGGAPGC